jgi:DNA processing protein
MARPIGVRCPHALAIDSAPTLTKDSRTSCSAVAQPDERHLRDVIELTLVPGIGSQTQRKLCALYPDISEFFSLTTGALEGIGIPADSCLSIATRRYRSMAQEILEWSRRDGCRLLPLASPGYPMLLKEIYDPPLLLYVRGQVEVLDLPCIAIVGTRRPTYYGLQMAQGLAADLAARGVCIVSGLARGIDGAAHRGCLESGPTVAVLGCGIDIVYPREHRYLTRKILECGLLLSEFPPGTSPSPQNFPVRNRLISGLALGTLIVEAGEYSGSLITARLAMEQNREVFGLPGNLTSPQSFGPNFLIKQGAKLVQSWRDIVEEFPPEIRHQILAREESRASETPHLELMTPEETKVLGILQTDQATQFDKLYRRSGLEIPRLSDVLLNLEMRGWIRQVPGNLYVKVARSVGQSP